MSFQGPLKNRSFNRNPARQKAVFSFTASQSSAALTQDFILLNGGASLQVMCADCGLRDKQDSSQTPAACLLTALCEDTTHRILYGCAISTKTLSEHDEWRPFLALFALLHAKRSCWHRIHLPSRPQGIVWDDRLFNSTRMFCLSGRIDTSRLSISPASHSNMLLPRTNMFLQQTRDWFWLNDSRNTEPVHTGFTLEELVLHLLQRCFYPEQMSLSKGGLYITRWFEWCTGKHAGSRQCEPKRLSQIEMVYVGSCQGASLPE